MALDPAAVRRGAVVLIRLPRDKARPAVVVRSDLLAELSYATVLPITTEPRAGISLRIDVAPSQENGLRAASQVMVDWPQTVRFSDMGQAIGKLDAATMRYHAADRCRVGDRCGQTAPHRHCGCGSGAARL
jgi:mRNA interferase MazF